jgi:hypothetical protein
MAYHLYFNPLDCSCKSIIGAIQTEEELQLQIYNLKEGAFPKTNTPKVGDCLAPQVGMYLLFKPDGEEYERLRAAYLPDGGVVQRGENIRFLAARTELYAGDDFVFSFIPGMGEFVVEYLGNVEKMPAIVCALGKAELRFRSVGNERKLAVWRALDKDFLPPAYFGIPFDF